jgi:phospho-N-acetylmuramoyl-pentapeptide-transferase
VKVIFIPALVALMTSILCTPLVVLYFRQRGFGQEIRDDGPQAHYIKRGTPTMGGVVIIGSTLAGYVAVHIWTWIRGEPGPTASGLLLLFLMVGLGVVAPGPSSAGSCWWRWSSPSWRCGSPTTRA